jgi:hypothetical protein
VQGVAWLKLDVICSKSNRSRSSENAIFSYGNRGLQTAGSLQKKAYDLARFGRKAFQKQDNLSQ